MKHECLCIIKCTCVHIMNTFEHGSVCASDCINMKQFMLMWGLMFMYLRVHLCIFCYGRFLHIPPAKFVIFLSMMALNGQSTVDGC